MKILVAYFSASGQTAKLAKTLAGVTGGDLFEIAPETAYTGADLDWMDKKSRSTIEMKDPKSRPAIAGKVADMAQYDTVFVGFPNLVVSGPAHHRDVPRKLRLFGQDRHPLCHLRRQRHGRRGRFEIRLLEGDKVAPRQAPEQPREHGKRAEMGREPGAVNKKSGPSEPLSRLRKNKKRAKRRVTSVFAVRKPWCTSNSPACALLNVPRIPKPAHLRRANILRSKILAEVGFISIEHFNYPWGERMK